MSELPIDAGSGETEPLRAAGGISRRLDLTVASIAIVISVISLIAGFLNAQSQQQMVAATSWPFLVYETTRNQNDDNGRTRLRISNQGVGPARLKSLIVRYQGVNAHGLIELLTNCCGLPPGTDWEQLNKLGLGTERRPVGLYRPGDGIDLVVLGRTTENAAIWDRLAQARLQMTF